MNTPQQMIEEFEKTTFDVDDEDFNPHGEPVISQSNARNFLLTSHIQLLEEMKERVGGTYENETMTDIAQPFPHKASRDLVRGYNKALDDTLATIDKKLAEYKKMQNEVWRTSNG